MWMYGVLAIILSLNYIVAYVPHHRVVRQNAYYSTECTTQTSDIGQCMNIRYCEPILDLLRNRGREQVVADFLRRSQCGFENGSPKVCCPVNNSPITNITIKPTIPWTETQCGKTDNHIERITGGKNASLGDWPWMVALGYRRGRNPTVEYSICGGTLISLRFVVTAAHCVSNLHNLQLTTARLGDLDLDPNADDKASPQDIEIDDIIPHPEYKTNPIINDIALVRLKKPAKYTKYVRPICLFKEEKFKKDEFYAKRQPYILGWGAVQWEGRSASRLQQATVKIIEHGKCIQNYASIKSAVINERVLCAGDTGKDSCQGDSGGPLIIPVTSENSYYLGGVVSYGIKCADPNYPGIYTRTAYYWNWISKTAGLYK